MDKYNGVFFPGEAEKTLLRLGKAVNDNIVTTEDLVRLAEYVAAMTAQGITVDDCMNAIKNAYPFADAAVRARPKRDDEETTIIY